MSEPRAGREHKGRVVCAQIRIETTPAELWEAWAKPDGIAQWFVDRAEGDMERDERVTWRFDAFGMELPVEVYAAERGRYLAFGGPARRPGGPPALQEVFVEQEGGHCTLRIVNSGFEEGAEWDDEYEGVASGWDMALATLKHWLERGSDAERRPRAHRLAVRPAAFEYEALEPWFTAAACLCEWLATHALVDGDERGLLTPGAEVELDFADAGLLTGRVLARTKREVLLEWSELGGVLGLKAFSAGPAGRMLALDLNAWGPGAGSAEYAEAAAALDARLVALAELLD